VNKQFKILLLVALSFLSSFNLSANDIFFSIEKEATSTHSFDACSILGNAGVGDVLKRNI